MLQENYEKSEIQSLQGIIIQVWLKYGNINEILKARVAIRKFTDKTRFIRCKNLCWNCDTGCE